MIQLLLLLFHTYFGLVLSAYVSVYKHLNDFINIQIYCYKVVQTPVLDMAFVVLEILVPALMDGTEVHLTAHFVSIICRNSKYNMNEYLMMLSVQR